MAQEQFQGDAISYEIGLKLRDLEENNRLMKERLLLIGQNLIESQEKNNHEITELKKQTQSLTSDIERIKNVVESISEEVSKSARKEELAILSRQFKMFEPLNLVRMEDIDKLIDEKVNKHKKHNTINEVEDKHSFWRGKL